jgi:hypothetical protein
MPLTCPSLHWIAVTSGIVGVYNVHAYIDEKRAALEKWADHLKELVR